MGDTQFLPGYCVLLAFPQVGSLNDLNIEQRTDFLVDMTLVGDSIMAVCNPIRVNYDISGNIDPFLHAHIVPRYDWEEEIRRKCPVAQYPKENWTDEEYQFTETKHGDLKKKLAEKLLELMSQHYK